MAVHTPHRKRVLLHCALVALGAACLCSCASTGGFHLPLPARLINRGTPWEARRPSYDGEGTLLAFMGDDAIPPRGSSVMFDAPLHSGILGQDRPLLVYLPPGYEQGAAPYPVIFAVHGFSSRPQTWAVLLLEALERGFREGTIPPLVVVMPDFSISGNGRDDSMTWFDDRAGNFGINSNLGRFEDHFFEEIVPFVSSRFNVRVDPGHVVLMGSSMGGYCTLYYALRRPSFSHILVPIYPCADLRYGVRGNKLADYDPAGYARLSNDKPCRVVNGTPLGGLGGLTEKWLYYHVFDSDRKPGPVWTEDQPVWKRLSEVNPVEMLDSAEMDLAGQRYYLIVGSADDFNLDAHIPLLVPRLVSRGAVVSPAQHILPGGRHSQDFILANVDAILGWIGEQLREDPAEK
jgi:hypothetical protein